MSNSVIPSGWLVLDLDQVLLSIVGGGTPSKSKASYYEGDIPWMTVKDLNVGFVKDTIDHISEDAVENSSTNVIPAGTPIVATRMSLGKVVTSKVDSAINQDLKALFFPEGVLAPYFVYWYRSIAREIEQLGTGTTVKGIRLENLRELEFPLAPLNEQTRIANKLDSLLAKVQDTQTRLEKIPGILKRFRQSVLAAATSGELTKEWRNRTSLTTESMLAEHQPPPRPARYKSRNKGFISGVVATAIGKPKEKSVDSWEWVPLVDIAEMGTGHTPSRSKTQYWDGDVCWIGIKDAREHHASTINDTIQKTNELGLENSAARLLPVDTVCISRTASVGYVVKMGIPMATSQDFVTWTPTKVLNPDWLKWLFVGEKESLFKFGRGTTHTTVYFPEWLSMHVFLPPLAEQKEIVRRVEAIFALADKVEQQYQAAKQRTDRLTQSLLAKAFRGELVPQDPNDEPASELLKRISAERAASVKAKPKRKKKVSKKKSGKQIDIFPTSKVRSSFTAWLGKSDTLYAEDTVRLLSESEQFSIDQLKNLLSFKGDEKSFQALLLKFLKGQVGQHQPLLELVDWDEKSGEYALKVAEEAKKVI